MAAVPSSLEPMKLGSGYHTPWWATAAKWGLLAIAGLFAAYVIQKLISSGSYTVATAFTNYGQGHTLSKQDATDRNLANSVKEVEGTERYKLSIAVPEGTDVATGEITFLLTKPDGSMFVGTSKGLEPLAADGIEKTDTGKITKAPGYTILNAREANKRSKDLNAFAVPVNANAGIKSVGISSAFEGAPTLKYDAAADTVTDTVKNVVYSPKNAYWTAPDGQTLATGWKENVGTKNFSDLLTNETIRSGFFKIFLWNVAFAALSVMSTFILGMLLALLFNDPKLKGKGFYRSMLILPYAIPGFVTALVWASMFNQEFGLINSLTHLNIDWLGNPWAAKAAILITNLWLGFPYMRPPRSMAPARCGPSAPSRCRCCSWRSGRC